MKKRQQQQKSRKPRKKRTLYSKLKGVQRQLPMITADYRRALADLLQTIVIIFLQIREKPDDFDKFCNDKFWLEARSRPSAEKTERLLYFLLLFACGREGNGPKDASFYNTALEALLVDGVPKELIAEEIISRGGLRAIVDEVRLQTKTEGAGQNDSGVQEGVSEAETDSWDIDEVDSDDVATELEIDLVDEEEGEPVSDRANGKTKATSSDTSPKAVKRITNKAPGIFIDTSKKVMETLCDLKRGSKFWVQVKCNGREKDGFAIMKLVEYEL